ncbi:MAG: hypothetical protein IPO97_05535 [Sphingomonadales bacterium]|nr:hypothetical protein [Sphingomonadales bacterium]
MLDAASPETSRLAQRLIEEHPDATRDEEIELDECGDLWADVLQDIVRRSPDLDHLTVTMAFTCSKMRPDGFVGLAMPSPPAASGRNRPNTLFDRFSYKEAAANGEISHGDS